ncbi:MAG: hypothetical protein QNJ30_02000 [Kiloniellales bacterium]|nr:hypothetical protein [Kiloniellales bacterium]
MRRKTLGLSLLLLVLMAAPQSPGATDLDSDYYTVGRYGLVSYPNVALLCPKQPAGSLFATCLPQKEIFQRARDHAAVENKLLLIDYGADSCIWCGVIDQYFDGNIGVQKEQIDHLDLGFSRQLAKTMSDNFILVHINAEQEAEAKQVMTDIGTEAVIGGPIPAFIALDPASGATERAYLENAENPVDGEYHGYNRPKLTQELRRTVKVLRP